MVCGMHVTHTRKYMDTHVCFYECVYFYDPYNSLWQVKHLHAKLVYAHRSLYLMPVSIIAYGII